VSLLFAIAPALPLGKAGKFVAGAYVVVFVVILAYVVIMAVRAQRVNRDLDQLQRDVDALKAERGLDESEPLERSDSEPADRSEQTV
jgi:heme exporter protein CcmD